MSLGDGAEAIRPLGESDVAGPRRRDHDGRRQRPSREADGDPATSRRGDDDDAVIVADRRQQRSLPTAPEDLGRESALDRGGGRARVRGRYPDLCALEEPLAPERGGGGGGG